MDLNSKVSTNGPEGAELMVRELTQGEAALVGGGTIPGTETPPAHPVITVPDPRDPDPLTGVSPCGGPFGRLPRRK